MWVCSMSSVAKPAEILLFSITWMCYCLQNKFYICMITHKYIPVDTEFNFKVKKANCSLLQLILKYCPSSCVFADTNYVVFTVLLTRIFHRNKLSI